MQIVMFSKHLAPLSVAESGKAVRDLGFKGLDLTVRPGGHVAPEDVRTALPEAAKSLGDLGLSLPMITTGITSAGDPHADPTLATASSLGIRELKLGYWPYRPDGRLLEQLDSARRDLDGLESLARRHGVRVSVHTHSGAFLSAAAGNLYILLKDRDPHHTGAYVDPGHLTLEGFDNGWRQGIDLLQRYLSMVAVKSFGFVREADPAANETRWSHQMVPLREGIVRWREVFGFLKQLGWDGIVTLHSEYQGSHSWKDLNTAELVEQTRDDLAYLQPILRGAGYSG